MSNVIKSVAAELTNKNKRVIIPAGSMLTTVNVVNVVENGNMEGLDTKIANVLSNELNNIRNNILPLIKEYGKFVNESIASRIDSNPLKDVNIHTVDLPIVIGEMISRNIININGDKSRRINDKSLVITRPDVSKIKEYLTYGSGQMESLIRTFISTIPDTELVRIWDTYLLNVSSMNNNFVTIGNKVNNGIYGLDLFVLSILVKNLVKTMPDTVRVPVSIYNDAIISLDAVLDNKIALFITNMEANTKIGKVILKGDNLNEVVVIKDNYNKFLNDGGSPEAIYGAILNKVSSLDIINLTKDKDMYSNKWDIYLKNETIKTKLGTLEQHRIAYRLGITELFNNFMDEELKASIPSGIVDNINDVIVAFLNNKKPEKLFDVNDIVEDFVTEVLFGHTNAEEFIKYMKHYSRLNPNITAKEAATYASADLVTDYLLTMIEIK